MSARSGSATTFQLHSSHGVALRSIWIFLAGRPRRSVIGVDHPQLVVVARWRPIPRYSRSMSVPRPVRFTVVVIGADELVRDRVAPLPQPEGPRVVSES